MHLLLADHVRFGRGCALTRCFCSPLVQDLDTSPSIICQGPGIIRSVLSTNSVPASRSSPSSTPQTRAPTRRSRPSGRASSNRLTKARSCTRTSSSTPRPSRLVVSKNLSESRNLMASRSGRNDLEIREMGGVCHIGSLRMHARFIASSQSVD